MEHYLREEAMHDELNEDGPNWKPMKSTLDDKPETNPSGGFECNICLDLVQDPVVTFCGHLYCWPCIYRWITSQDSTPSDPQKPQCPVCKSEVSEKTLIPLYGRGQTTPKDELSRLVVPQRPPSPSCTIVSNPVRRFGQLPARMPYPSGSYNMSPTPAVFSGATPLADPMIGMFGEMVYARIFGNNSETTLYAYPNSYRMAGSSSPRLRRHMMQSDKSLSRVCFFLWCCFVVCLLLF